MAFLPSNLHVNRPLSDLVIAYTPSKDGWLRDRFFPRKIVDKQANQIRQISRDQMLRLYPMITGASGRVQEVQFGTDSTLTYSATTFALQVVLDNWERQNADSELQYDVRQMDAPLQALNLGLEKYAIADTVRSTGVLTNNQTNTTAQYWSNYNSVSSDPIDDLMIACQRVMTETGNKANTIAMDIMVWKKLAQHPNVLSRAPIHGGGATGAIMTPAILEDILAPWCEKGALQITAKRYNNANEGATGTLKSFIGPDVVVAYAAPPSLSSYGLGFEFAYNGLAGSEPFLVLTYQDMNRGVLGSDVARLVGAVDYKVTNAKAGYLIKTVVDTTLSEFSSQL